MTHEKANNLVIGIIAALLLIMFATCSTGCLTAKNLPKHNDKFPLAAAEYAAGKYPRRDSIGAPKLDSIKKSDNVDYSLLIDSIYKSLGVPVDTLFSSDYTERPVFVGSDCDSLVEQTERLSAMIMKLRREYKPCKPDSIFFTADHFEVDGPAITAANLRAEKEKADKIKVIEELTGTKDKLDEWRHKAHIRFWIITSLILLLLFLFAISVGKFLKKKSNPLL